MEKTQLQEFVQRHGLNYVMQDLQELAIDKEVLKILRPVDAKRYNALPLTYDKNSRKATLIISNPESMVLADFLFIQDGIEVDFVWAEPLIISTAITYYYQFNMAGLENVLGSEFQELQIVEEEEHFDKEEARQLEEASSAAPIISFVDKVIADAVHKRASDIHMEPRDSGLTIRYRIDGVLQDQPASVPEAVRLPVTSRLKIISKCDIGIKKKPQDGAFQVRLNRKYIDFRISFVPLFNDREKIVIRIMDRGDLNLDLNRIGFDDAFLKKYRSIVHRTNGMFLIIGPTGTGKTTTLYATLAEYTTQQSSRNKSIISIEDPVEVQIQGVSQMQASKNISFADGLRTILRSDPEIIMVGEIRDEDTAQIATRAANSGHMILSTLHTDSSLSAVSRLVDLGASKGLVVSVLRGAMSQRLVRQNCPHCRVEYTPTKASLDKLSDTDRAALQGAKFYRGEGCRLCNDVGFYGRIPVYELFIMTAKLRDMFSRDCTIGEIRAYLEERGYRSLWQCGLERVKKGDIMLEELIDQVDQDEKLDA